VPVPFALDPVFSGNNQEGFQETPPPDKKDWYPGMTSMRSMKYFRSQNALLTRKSLSFPHRDLAVFPDYAGTIGSISGLRSYYWQYSRITLLLLVVFPDYALTTVVFPDYALTTVVFPDYTGTTGSIPGLRWYYW
jgi:hypothetical protein